MDIKPLQGQKRFTETAVRMRRAYESIRKGRYTSRADDLDSSIRFMGLDRLTSTQLKEQDTLNLVCNLMLKAYPNQHLKSIEKEVEKETWDTITRTLAAHKLNLKVLFDKPQILERYALDYSII